MQRTLLAIAFGFCLIGCDKRLHSNSETSINACDLLKSNEIEAIQGVPVAAGRGSANANNGFRTSQCYYAASESSKSVSITVTQRNPENPGKRTAKNVWDHMFSEDAREEKEREGEHEEGEKMAAPVKVDGVGDEAYWTGARFGGALYVLSREKDTFMRISVGGADSEEGKIEKSRTLARKAFGRL